MKKRMEWIVTHILHDQSGQVLVWLALSMVVILGFAGLSLDVGHAYYVRNQLQDSANMAALAGAEALPYSSSTTLPGKASPYSSAPGSKNAFSNLGTVTNTVTASCLTTLTKLGLACGGAASANAVKVVESVSVPTFFLRVIGIRTIQVSAAATAALAKAIPYNVAVIVDTTLSMNNEDTNCGNTQLNCSMNGVEVLLNSLSPSNDNVSLFTFPNVTASTVPYDYCSTSSSGSVNGNGYGNGNGNGNGYGNGTSQATAGAYSVPTAGASSYPSTSDPTYQIVGYSNDYRTSDTASSLNPNSNLVKAAGQLAADGITQSVAGCLGPPNSAGNYGTWLAGALYAAQASLVAEHTVHKAQGVIILLSDGNSNASNAYTGYGAMFPSGVTASGTYPSYVGDCGQEIVAANAAKTAGTQVFTIAYGSPATGLWIPGDVNDSHCPTDQNGFFSTYKLGANVSSYPGISPCQAMQDMASPDQPNGTQYFYSDYNQSGSNSQCYSPNSDSPTALKSIFSAIGEALNGARLIPNGTT